MEKENYCDYFCTHMGAWQVEREPINLASGSVPRSLEKFREVSCQLRVLPSELFKPCSV